MMTFPIPCHSGDCILSSRHPFLEQWTKWSPKIFPIIINFTNTTLQQSSVLQLPAGTLTTEPPKLHNIRHWVNQDCSISNRKKIQTRLLVHWQLSHQNFIISDIGFIKTVPSQTGKRFRHDEKVWNPSVTVVNQIQRWKITNGNLVIQSTGYITEMFEIVNPTCLWNGTDCKSHQCRSMPFRSMPLFQCFATDPLFTPFCTDVNFSSKYSATGTLFRWQILMVTNFNPCPMWWMKRS